MAKQADVVKTPEQLLEELNKLQAEYQNYKKMHVAGELPNPRVLANTRKAIARVKTNLVQCEKESK